MGNNTGSICGKLWISSPRVKESKSMYTQEQLGTWYNDSNYSLCNSRFKERRNRSMKALNSIIVLHLIVRTVISCMLGTAVIASVILLFIGVLLDHRACLTSGCVLGLVSLGVLLHGCLSHRTLPDYNTPLVLSAACVYPVGALPYNCNNETDTAAVAVMKTSTRLRSSIERPSTIIIPPSTLSPTLQNVTSHGPTCSEVYHHSLNIKRDKISGYEIPVSDCISCCTSHLDFNGVPKSCGNESPCGPATLTTQNSCPSQIENATRDKSAEHLYVNTSSLGNIRSLHLAHFEVKDFISDRYGNNSRCSGIPSRSPLSSPCRIAICQRPDDLKLITDSVQLEGCHSKTSKRMDSIPYEVATHTEMTQITPSSTPTRLIAHSATLNDTLSQTIPYSIIHPLDNDANIIQLSLSHDLLRYLSQEEPHSHENRWFGRRERA